MNPKKKRAVVAMSGGVDSSVTAALLLEQGYEVIGLTMQLGVQPSAGGFSTASQDRPGEPVADARRVADFLAIPFHVVNFKTEFKWQVVEPFCEDYLAGLTPNPCVVCNQTVKFDLLLNKALEVGGDVMATGHYAILSHEGDRYHLRKGEDLTKDQSYFLYTLTQQKMAQTLFPLGALTKTRVRELARQYQLPTAQKSESQDICFVPDGDYARFLEQQRPDASVPGAIVHLSGEVLGRHQGTYRYTVGQRKGLGISWKEPLYVLRLDAARQQVIVGEKEHLACSRLTAHKVNWIGPPPSAPFKATCRIRYGHQGDPAMLSPRQDGRVSVEFERAQNGVTPGQSVVFYDGDDVLGGGVIQ